MTQKRMIKLMRSFEFQRNIIQQAVGAVKECGGALSHDEFIMQFFAAVWNCPQLSDWAIIGRIKDRYMPAKKLHVYALNNGVEIKIYMPKGINYKEQEQQYFNNNMVIVTEENYLSHCTKEAKEEYLKLRSETNESEE